MRILWVNNIAIPKIAKDIGIDCVHTGGWMVKLADEVSKSENIHLTIACPCSKDLEGSVESIDYMTFHIDRNKLKVKDISKQSRRIEQIIRDVNPDVIHIFGTEEIHSYLFVDVAQKLGLQDKVVVSIQGLDSIYALHYNAFLPEKISKRFTIRDLLRGNVNKGKRLFQIRGELEKITLKKVTHIIGRTDWDRACTWLFNPNAKYHFNNEMLRQSFYTAKKWSLDSCKKHSVFLSQATLPLKGLHLALQAINILHQFYPDLSVRIAGKSYYQKSKLKLSYYEKFILNYINKNNLKNVVEFTGFLSEKEMIQEYLNSNAFVSASSIENSPNSVCEAMFLGVPTVSSFVGGINTLIDNGINGFLYQADAPYMLAYYIDYVFKNDMSEISNNAISASAKRHDITKILKDLIEIYNDISK